MAKIKRVEPEMMVLEFHQEQEDEDYGTCLWARFVFDLEKYVLHISSNCGNFVCNWTPTPQTESFIKLMSRVNEDYLLDKLSKLSVVDPEKTFSNIKEFMEGCRECCGIGKSNIDYGKIEDACYSGSKDEVYNAVIGELEYALSCAPDCNGQYTIHNEIVMHYPVQAKKIAEIFIKYIKPYLSENCCD